MTDRDDDDQPATPARPQRWFPWFELGVLAVAGSQGYASLTFGHGCLVVPVFLAATVAMVTRSILGRRRGPAATWLPLGIIVAVYLCFFSRHHLFVLFHGDQLLHAAATGTESVQPLGFGKHIVVSQSRSESVFRIPYILDPQYLIHAPHGSPSVGGDKAERLFGSWYRYLP